MLANQRGKGAPLDNWIAGASERPVFGQTTVNRFTRDIFGALEGASVLTRDFTEDRCIVLRVADTTFASGLACHLTSLKLMHVLVAATALKAVGSLDCMVSREMKGY